jgi:hypothetical protein
MRRDQHLQEVMAFLLLMLGLSGCDSWRPVRERAIDAALLQPVDVPLGWEFEWFNRDENSCKGRWNTFNKGDLQPNIDHAIFDCPSDAVAKALMYSLSTPKLRATRSPIVGDKPVRADEFLAYCDTPASKRQLSPTQIVSERYCTTLARYGRVVSLMEINAILPSNTWPLEIDLMRWATQRNDRRLSQLPD